jgi:hypothetical protein
MRPVPSPVLRPSSESPVQEAGAEPAWGELSALVRHDADDRPFLIRLLKIWSKAQGATASALYLTNGETLELEAGVGEEGDGDFPDEIAPSAAPEGLTVRPLPGGAVVMALALERGERGERGERLERGPVTAEEPLTLLLATTAKSCLL